MNTLPTLLAGVAALPSSRGPGLLRNTQVEMQDTPARHLSQALDRNTQPPVQDSDRSNQLGMLDISALHILVLLLSGQSMQSPHHPGMRHPAPQPTRAQLSKATEDNRTLYPRQEWRGQHLHEGKLGQNPQYFTAEPPTLEARYMHRTSTSIPARHPRFTPRSPPSDMKDKVPRGTRCSSLKTTSTTHGDKVRTPTLAYQQWCTNHIIIMLIHSFKRYYSVPYYCPTTC